MHILTKRKYTLPNALLLAAVLICILILGVKRQFYREVTAYVSSIENPGWSQQVTVPEVLTAEEAEALMFPENNP